MRVLDWSCVLNCAPAMQSQRLCLSGSTFQRYNLGIQALRAPTDARLRGVKSRFTYSKVGSLTVKSRFTYCQSTLEETGGQLCPRLQGYLADKKLPPRTLQYAYA